MVVTWVLLLTLVHILLCAPGVIVHSPISQNDESDGAASADHRLGNSAVPSAQVVSDAVLTTKTRTDLVLKIPAGTYHAAKPYQQHTVSPNHNGKLALRSLEGSDSLTMSAERNAAEEKTSRATSPRIRNKGLAHSLPLTTQHDTTFVPAVLVHAGLAEAPASSESTVTVTTPAKTTTGEETFHGRPLCSSPNSRSSRRTFVQF